MDTLLICIYADETQVFTDDFCNMNNLIYVEIPRDIVFGFFKENVLADFRTEEDLSDEALFEDWLLEYTADDTIGLWQYSLYHTYQPLINGTM